MLNVLATEYDKFSLFGILFLVTILFFGIIIFFIFQADKNSPTKTNVDENRPEENLYENVVFKERLKELMEVNGETIYTLSDALGVTPGTVLLWIKDDRQPTEEQLYDLASYFGCTREYLYGHKKATIKQIKKEYHDDDSKSSILLPFAIIGIAFLVLLILAVSCTGCLNR